jgi:large subunit ribosomal protein L7Ae
MPKKEMQPNKKSAAKKKLPAAPLGGNAPAKVKKNPIFEKKTRSFRIGGDIQPKRDLTRFTKWPQYVRLQRQKRILMQRVKVPPTIAQFQHTLSRDQVSQLARLCKKIKPETKDEKKARLEALAGKKGESKAVPVIKFGLNHVTELVEKKKANLVVIAHDVDPVELVCWLPALCRKMDVPYCIIKSKARLGQLVGQKTAAAAAIVNVPQEDVSELKAFKDNVMAQFNNSKDATRKWGGGLVGRKSEHVLKRREAILERERAKKAGAM